MGRRNKDRRMKYFKEITTILFLAFILMLMVKDGQAQRIGVNKPRVNKNKQRVNKNRQRFRKRTIKRRVRRAPVRRSIAKPKPKPKKKAGQGQIKRKRTCGKKCQIDKLHYLWLMRTLNKGHQMEKLKLKRIRNRRRQ